MKWYNLKMQTTEIECRFLEIDKEKLVAKLISLGAKDLGEIMLEETIIYDPEQHWKKDNKFIRLRKSGDKIILTYKEHRAHTIDGTYEIEFEISDMKKAEILLEHIGLKAYRYQQKKRHTLELNDVTFDIDTWPKIPTYVELESKSEKKIKEAAGLVGLKWEDARFENASYIIENIYKIPVRSLRWFTFERVE